MQVIKRDGQVAEFDPDKIYQAILKAAQTVYVLTDDLRQNLAQVTKKVVLDLEEAKVERATISMIQSMVEHRLLGAGYITIAEHYISYRLQRDLERSGYGDHIAVHLHFEQIIVKNFAKNVSRIIRVSDIRRVTFVPSTIQTAQKRRFKKE